MKIAVYGKDSYYINRICEVMSDKYKPDKEFIPFDEESVERAFTDSSYSLYLVSEEKEEIVKEKGLPYLLFTKEREKAEKFPNRYLFSFQNVIDMEKRINDCLNMYQVYKIDFNMCGKNNMITFVSLGGGMGSSAVAMGAAAYYSRLNQKVLYLNLKAFHATGYFQVGQGGTKLSELIQDVREKEGHLVSLMDNIAMDHTGVYVLENDIDALSSISSHEMELLFDYMEVTGGFQLIILDMEKSAAQWFPNILKRTFSINIVLDGSEDALKRWRQASTYFRKLNNGSYEKIKLIFNKYKAMPKEKEIEEKIVGGIMQVQGGNVQDVFQKVVNMKFLDNLLK